MATPRPRSDGTMWVVLESLDLFHSVGRFAGWRALLALRCVSSRVAGAHGQRDAFWRLLSHAVAEDTGAMHLPADAGAVWGWRRFFFEHVWPARDRWGAADAEDFDIRVAVRFRPALGGAGDDGGDGDGEEGEPRRLLPLHQRLRLVRQGKLSREDLFRQESATGEQMAGLLGDQRLPPDVVQAVMEAEYLASAADHTHSGTPDRRRRGRRHHGHDGAQPLGGALDAAADEQQQQQPQQPQQQPHNRGEYADAAAAARGGAAAGQGGQDDSKEDDAGGGGGGDGERRKRDKPRVVAVRPTQAVVYVPGSGVRAFAFSSVHSDGVEQRDVYNRSARDAVVSFLNGFNSCVLAYGQTGSGKTHTVFGPAGSLESRARLGEDPRHGVVPRALAEVMHAMRESERNGVPLRLTARYVQIYQGSITDLRNRTPAFLYDTGGGEFALESPGGGPVRLRTLDDARDLLLRGERNKSFAATAANERSSRAHTVLALTLEATHPRRMAVATSELYLVDLAGCEQVKHSEVQGERLAEAIGINSSLLVLGRVVRALLEGSPHVPYRGSVLTRLLRGAFGGTSRTYVLTCCAPEPSSGEQTLHALRFAERCASLTNTVGVAAMSVDDAMAAIRDALAKSEATMAGLAAAGANANATAAARLRHRHDDLLRRLNEVETLAMRGAGLAAR